MSRRAAFRRRGLPIIAAALLLSACYPPVPPGDDYAVRWAHTLSGPSNEDEIDGVAAGAASTVFVTGKFERSATIGSTVLSSAGQADIPFARLDYFGRVLWATRFGGTGEDNLFDVDADEQGAVGTGWFETTVDFGSVRLRSAGASDCVVIALDNEGSVRWARALGGPYRDGCNEVTLGADGSIVTSLDTEGGWTPPGLPAIPRLDFSDTLLVRLEPDGQVDWTRRVGGPGPQRGKALAVGSDGSIAFGGDTIGPLDVAGTNAVVPGDRRDAWLSHWTPTGTPTWVKTWGGPGDDLVKGAVYRDASVYAIGSFTGTIDVDGVTLDAGSSGDIAVTRFTPAGSLSWATSVTAAGALTGAEAIAAPGGGVLFGGTRAPGMQFLSPDGTSEPLDEGDGGTAWLAHYRADGSVAFATTIAGTASGNAGELARTGPRVYVDVVLRGQDNTVNGVPIATEGKDASIWGLDLATT